MAIRRFSTEQGVDSQEGVEPPTSLVNRFRDVVRWVLQRLSRTFNVGVAHLCERHCSRVKPHVDDRSHTRRSCPTGRARNRDGVDARTVRINVLDVTPRQLRQLRQ